MPFYWRFKDKPGITAGEPPGRVPFGFGYDPTFDLFIETRSPELTRLLDDIYARHANVGFLQDGNSMINTYGADFWRFLTALLKDHPVKSVLEVGCGGCVLLERLKQQGCGVTGIDPSPFAAEAGQLKGIPVIQEYFPPSVGLPQRPDLIFQVDVLEHIEDPLSFLQAQAEVLDEGGMIVVNVPDCSRSLELGDISMALHQHVNMFDTVSLPALFRVAGLEVIRLEKSQYGSALYCAARKTARAISPVPAKDEGRWERFEKQANINVQRFDEALQEARRAGGTLGFFMPQRAFPYLGIVAGFEGFRVFDNLNLWHRRYLDGLDMTVENQADLVAKPVDHIFVMSLTFGEQVAAELRRQVPTIQVTTLAGIIAGNRA
jgi:SAM-dependent methyltransferase